MLPAFVDPHAIACLSCRGSRLKRVPQASPACIPEIRNASDKPSDNDPRQPQPERDVSRQCYTSELR